MNDDARESRRRVLAMASAAGAVLAGGWLSHAAAAAQRRTARQTTGPFYPLEFPADSDADLTRVAGRAGRAQGQVICVTGRVLDVGGAPLRGVKVEIWQANTFGRYSHPGDGNPAPLDPDFQGFARVITAADGAYRFKTIKPAGYPAGGFRRPPHIHFAVEGSHERLVTQMYFAGEPLNDRDPLLAAAGEGRGGLVATLESPGGGLEPGALLARWDIVLEKG